MAQHDNESAAAWLGSLLGPTGIGGGSDDFLKSLLGNVEGASNAVGALASQIPSLTLPQLPSFDIGKSISDYLGKGQQALAAANGSGKGGSSNGFQFDQSSLISNALSGAISGAKSGGLIKGITGGLSSLASSAGSQIGSALGGAVGAAMGGVGAPIGAAIGSVLGSTIASTGADMVLKPVEDVAKWAGDTAKETIGTGFGLTDLAKGSGGRTARQDIYNFNGMDPKSAAISVERVRRRRSLAQQRGGGLGR